MNAAAGRAVQAGFQKFSERGARVCETIAATSWTLEPALERHGRT